MRYGTPLSLSIALTIAITIGVVIMFSFYTSRAQNERNGKPSNFRSIFVVVAQEINRAGEDYVDVLESFSNTDDANQFAQVAAMVLAQDNDCLVSHWALDQDGCLSYRLIDRQQWYTAQTTSHLGAVRVERVVLTERASNGNV